MDPSETPQKGFFKFTKSERLSSKKLVDKLFGQGKAINLPPIRVVFLTTTDIPNHQVLFSVPKKLYKRAVDRNRLKRQLREAYRLNKHHLATETSAKLLIAYIYNRKREQRSTFDELQSRVIDSLARLNLEIEDKRKES